MTTKQKQHEQVRTQAGVFTVVQDRVIGEDAFDILRLARHDIHHAMHAREQSLQSAYDLLNSLLPLEIIGQERPETTLDPAWIEKHCTPIEEEADNATR